MQLNVISRFRSTDIARYDTYRDEKISSRREATRRCVIEKFPKITQGHSGSFVITPLSGVSSY